jgi:hypothetical protein
MSKKSTTPFPIHDDVDRALLQVYRAACKLVMIAATNRYTPYAVKAAEALTDLGSMAAVPVASVIEQIPWESRRRLMATVLRDIPPLMFCLDVPLILMRIAASDPSEEVRAVAAETAEILRKRSHERGKRLGALVVEQYRIPAEESGTAAG